MNGVLELGFAVLNPTYGLWQEIATQKGSGVAQSDRT